MVVFIGGNQITLKDFLKTNKKKIYEEFGELLDKSKLPEDGIVFLGDLEPQPNPKTGYGFGRAVICSEPGYPLYLMCNVGGREIESRWADLKINKKNRDQLLNEYRDFFVEDKSTGSEELNGGLQW